MSWLGFIVNSVFLTSQLSKEAREKPMPPGAYFDKEAEYQDLINGVPYSVRRKKIENGDYWVIPGEEKKK